MQPFKLTNTRTHTYLLHSNIANLCTPWGLYCLQLCYFPPTGVGYTYTLWLLESFPTTYTLLLSQPVSAVTHKAAAGQRNYTAKQKGDLPPHAKTSSKISGPSTNSRTTHYQKWHAILAPFWNNFPQNWNKHSIFNSVTSYADTFHPQQGHSQHSLHNWSIVQFFTHSHTSLGARQVISYLNWGSMEDAGTGIAVLNPGVPSGRDTRCALLLCLQHMRKNVI